MLVLEGVYVGVYVYVFNEVSRGTSPSLCFFNSIFIQLKFLPAAATPSIHNIKEALELGPKAQVLGQLPC